MAILGGHLIMLMFPKKVKMIKRERRNPKKSQQEVAKALLSVWQLSESMEASKIKK
jgi:hypothetical protein